MHRIVIAALLAGASLVPAQLSAQPGQRRPRAQPIDPIDPYSQRPIEASPYARTQPQPIDPVDPYARPRSAPPRSVPPPSVGTTVRPIDSIDPYSGARPIDLSNPYAGARPRTRARPIDSIDPYVRRPIDQSDPYATLSTSGGVVAQVAGPAPSPSGPARAAQPAAPAPAPEPGSSPAEPSSQSFDPLSPFPRRVGLADIGVVQGLLAVQHLDGWLLFDRDGENPIAVRLVAPDGHPTRAWFYMIPARGNPVALVHSAELRSFDHLAGTKLTYLGYRDLDSQLRAMLKGVKSVAVEYSPKAAVPSVSRVDAGTLEVIRAAGVQVKSSDTLVQFTKAIWGDAGRTAHYVAVHHIVELRKEALAFVVKQLQSGAPVTEYDVQQRLVRGMAMRALIGAPPVVAAGANTADPYYVPSSDKSAPIKRGDLIVISLAAKIDKPEGIYAAQTWCAVADQKVPDAVAKAFETASLARDQAMALIGDRARRHRPVTGAEVDDVTRAFIKKAGLADRVMHRTGHSIDNDLQGGGADLDDFEVRDSRILTPGTGFTAGPGLYFPGQFGVRSEVSVYLAPNGPDITTPAQDEVEALFKP